ncbi:hypothetical protein [Nostoc flagelliforme]|uniref:hypothetical protein n=1 Tax=Nostoc flagelliforme TaxID=1306274 RepID=UPI001CECB3F6|nr:hypothetical protein [Nostoc flagelliforme]
MNTSYTIRKKSVLYLLLGNNRAIAGYTKALEFRNGKSFRRVTEEGYGEQDGKMQLKNGSKSNQKISRMKRCSHRSSRYLKMSHDVGIQENLVWKKSFKLLQLRVKYQQLRSVQSATGRPKSLQTKWSSAK